MTKEELEAAKKSALNQQAVAEAFNQLAVENAIGKAALLCVGFNLKKEDFLKCAASEYDLAFHDLRSRTNMVLCDLVKADEMKEAT